MERIAGLVNLRGSAGESHREMVRAMCRWQVYGALDEPRIVMTDRVCMAATSLRNTGFSDDDIQPLWNEDKSRLIVFNGQIYNFSELREHLVERGYKFRSQAASEVALHTFEEWGEDCPDQLTGMFACVVYDRKADTVTLVRDRFGVKPLYYTFRDGQFCFASEMKPLVYQLSPLRPNREALIEWFLYGVVLTAEELFQDIYSVPPGSVLTVRQEQVSSPHCYYSPISAVETDMYRHLAKCSSVAVLSNVEKLLDRSIQYCLAGDDPVSTLLSGGVDSSLLTALAVRHRDVTAFHVSVPDDPRLDERRPAEEIAKYLGVPLVVWAMDRDTFLRELSRVIYLNESPLTHIQSVAFYHGVQLAQGHGVRALLVGDAADTVFGGHWSRYGRQKQLLFLQWFFARLPKRLRTALQLTSYGSSGIPICSANVEQLLPHTVHFLDRYGRMGLYRQCEEAYAFVTSRVERAILATKLADLVDDLTWYFQRGDRLGMAASVDYRVPFLDEQLIKLAVNLPWSYHTRGRTEKWALKKVAARMLPRHLVYREKVPWGLPVQQYITPFACQEFFKGGFCVNSLGLNPIAIEEIISATDHFLPPLFNLVNLEIWGRLFFLGQTVEQLEEYCRRVVTDARIR